MQTIEILPGATIEQAARILCDHAPARCCFNGIDVRARYATTQPADLVATWSAKMHAQSVAWSPARIARAEQSKREVEQAQAKVDALITALDAIDWTDHAGPIAWLVALSEPAARIGVHFDHAAIYRAFLSHAYDAGVYCGEAFDETSRDIVARWIVGQGLDAILRGMAPHRMIERFAAQWAERFPVIDSDKGAP
jgi:hypothetical protein